MKDKKAIVWQIWQLLLFLYLGYKLVRFQNGCNKVEIELREFWSEIELALSDQNALHPVQLPL